MFSGVSAFDRHQTFPESGVLACHEPGSRGLVRRFVRGVPVWGWPERDEAWIRARRGAESDSEPRPTPEYPEDPEKA